jgi:hypothetical protein
MQRITDKFLQAKIDYLNKITGNPSTYCTREDGRTCTHIGHYCLSHAYGGVCLHQICNESGGVRDVFNCGHVTKRELATMISAYTYGLEDSK